MGKYGYMATIGADTSGLRSALKDIEAESRNISREITEINKSIKFDDAGTVALQQKYDLLGQLIETTRKKLEQLKSAEAAVNEAAANGKISEQNQRSYQREVDSTINKLVRYEKELEQTRHALNGAEVSTDKAEKETKKLGTALDEAGKSTIAFRDLLKANILSDFISDGIHKLTNEVADFVKSGIEVASDLTEVQNVVDVTFGDGAAQIYKWADAAATSFGMSTLAAQKYNGTMGAMLKSSGLADEEVLKMSQDIVGLAGDMASFYNLDVETAFNKIRSGISGETEPLKQLGINMSVANMEAYALSQGIEKSWKSMSQAEQTQLRYAYLLSVTTDAQGDFVRTADSYANQQRIMQLNMENLSASLGKQLLPHINELITAFNDKLPQSEKRIEAICNIIGTLTGFVLDNQKAIISLAAGFGTFYGVMKGGTALVNTVATFKELITALNSATTAQEALNVVTSANPYVLLASAIAAVTVSLVALAATAEETTYSLIESAEKSKQAYDEQVQKVNELEKELEKVKERIDEINSKDKLSITDAQELTNLRLQNGELEAQLELEKKILEIRRKAANDDNVAAIMDEDYGIAVALREEIEAYKNARDDFLATGDEISEKNMLELQLDMSDSLTDLNNFGKELDLTTEKGKVAFDTVKSLTNEVYELMGIASDIPEDAYKAEYSGVTTSEIMVEKYKREAEDRKAANEQALKDEKEKLDELKDLRKITEDEYYEQLAKSLEVYKDTESKAYWELVGEYEKYLDKKASAEEKAEKERIKSVEDAEKERVNLIKKGWDDITRMRERGLIDEEKEYKLKAQYVKKYCDEKVDTWDSYYSWLYAFSKKKEDAIAEEQRKTWEDNAKKLADVQKKAYEDLKKQKEKVRQDLSKISLYEVVTDVNGKEVTVLSDLEKEKKKLDDYINSMKRLNQSGIPKSLINEINKLSFEDGSRQRYIDAILSLSEGKRREYYADWESLEETRDKAASEAVADDIEQLNKATKDAVDKIYDDMPSSAYAKGRETAENYIQGIRDEMNGLADEKTIQDITSGNFNIAGKAANFFAERGGTAGGFGGSLSEKINVIPTSTRLVFNLGGQTVEKTIQELIDKGRVTGGNILNL